MTKNDSSQTTLTLVVVITTALILLALFFYVAKDKGDERRARKQACYAMDAKGVGYEYHYWDSREMCVIEIKLEGD